MTTKKTYGKTRSGRPITDDLVEQLAQKAAAGYDVDEMLRRRGAGRIPQGVARQSDDGCFNVNGTTQRSAGPGIMRWRWLSLPIRSALRRLDSQQVDELTVVHVQIVDLDAIDGLGGAYLVVWTIAARLIWNARIPVRLRVEFRDPCHNAVPLVVSRRRSNSAVAQCACVAKGHPSEAVDLFELGDLEVDLLHCLRIGVQAL